MEGILINQGKIEENDETNLKSYITSKLRLIHSKRPSIYPQIN